MSSYFSKRKKQIKLFNDFFSPRPKLDCVTKKNTVLSGKVKIEKRIGIPSRNGEVFRVCYDNCKFQAVLKKIPLDSQALKYFKYRNSSSVLNYFSPYAETYILKLTNLLVKNDITPHIPYSLKPLTCAKDCKFVNEEILKEYSHSGINGCELLVVEIEDGTLDELYEKKVLINLEILVAFFQIFMGIYCIRKYFDIEHYDLHAGNVLYKKIPKGGKICYKIGKKTISIPNIGYVFMIWDFGFSRIPGVLEQNERRSHYKKYPSKFYDLFRILEASETYPIPREPLRIIKYFLRQVRGSSEAEKDSTRVIGLLLEELSKVINERLETSKDTYSTCIASFNTNKKLKASEIPRLT